MTKIFRQYDQASLDAQYNNRARYPDYKHHFDNWGKWSKAARSQLQCKLNVAFGPTPIEAIDIFPAAAPMASIYVFIHGGYWYSLDKADYSYVAQGMRPHGITTVVNNFGLAPEHDMDTIVAQNRAALAWIWKNAESYGGDRNRIYVAGHSAGGHLGALLLATNWPAIDPALPVNLVKGVCAIGGIFDLEPIRLSYLNQKIRLTPEQSRKYSPLAVNYPVSAPLSLVVAVDESDEFHRQSRQMRDHWESLGWPVESLTPPGLDHFSVVNNLSDPECMLVHHQLAQMKLAFE
jgi:arylformamidase